MRALRPFLLSLLVLITAGPAFAELPRGYFVWIKGDSGDRTSRKVYRMTLPGKTEVMALTSGEDVECQISPDGKWVAYAKAMLPDTDYHQFNRFKLYLVSIHGVGEGREEIKLDDSGYWPSWGGPGELYYAQVDDEHRQHTKIKKILLDEYGGILSQETVLATHDTLSGITEVNETFVAPDGSWFAARTRGSPSVSGAGAITTESPSFSLLAQAGAVGCMPYIAPSSSWGFIAGRDHGIRWGHAPQVSDRLQDQRLVAPHGDGYCYHPGISSDENWLMVGHGSDDDHNAGRYDIYLYELDGQVTSAEQSLVSGGFNGWPHLWVGEPSDPPPPLPHIGRFFPDSYTLVGGEQLLLTWQTSFADSVSLDGTPVDLDGSATFSPSQSTRYLLEASSSLVEPTDSASVDITVHDSAQAVAIRQFTAEPDKIVAGQTAVLHWQVDNPYSLEIDGVQVPPTGNMAVNPMVDQRYTLSAQGHQGPVSQELTVEVVPQGELYELLPDRGGCHCAGAEKLSVLPLLLGLGLGLVALRRRRCRR